MKLQNEESEQSLKDFEGEIELTPTGIKAVKENGEFLIADTGGVAFFDESGELIKKIDYMSAG